MKRLSDCRVLLVDDAKANLDILVEGLKGDHKLSVAMDGETALQIAARIPPDLVLLDIVMPGMDGYEVCSRLRRMPETAEVPIMFLSSLEEVQNKTRGFEAGANDFLTKPFETRTGEGPIHVPSVARGGPEQDPRLRGGRERLLDQAVRDARGEGARSPRASR